MLEEKLLTVTEVAEYLRLNPRTVSNKAQKGIIPAKKIGGKWRFTFSTIRDFCDTPTDSHERYSTTVTQLA